jgi:HK97 family phage prohead protease
MEETRIYPMVEFEVRQMDDGQPPEIVGYAAVYNALSEDLGGFREIVRPGFFTPVLGNDVRATINHSPQHVLGRSSAGTLILEDDEKGLLTRIRTPDTSYARDLLVSMDRGDIDQMSFIFRVAAGGEKWGRVQEGWVVRELIEAKELRDVAVVTYPAYPQTSAEARSKASELAASGGQAGGAADEVPEVDIVQEHLARYRRRIDLKKRRQIL